ncbi:hypothetical protein [Chitinibacter tainanensis]|uniref:hypothetical protein n=1 Tax=Chitinibacter tainanensis TaxID=230667 RepID=UPI0023545781|nr:hypothetical protein [Chitinibacter tainanensis]
MLDPFDPAAEMDTDTQHAWAHYLALADAALAWLSAQPRDRVLICAQSEIAYWRWQGPTDEHLAWAPIAEGMICLEAAILLHETHGLSQHDIEYRLQNLLQALQQDPPTTLRWPAGQLQSTVRPPF